MPAPEFVCNTAIALVFLAILRGVKLAGYAAARPTFGDGLWAASLAAVPALAKLAGGLPAGAAGAFAVVVLLVVVWLGVTCWRTFTVELGPLALVGFGLSDFFREPFEVDWVRAWMLRFCRDNPAFAVLPLMVVGWLGIAFLPAPTRTAVYPVLIAALMAWLGMTPARAQLTPWLSGTVAAMSGAAVWSGIFAYALTWQQLAAAPALLLTARLLRRRKPLRGSLAGDCLRPRPWPSTACRFCPHCASGDAAGGTARAVTDAWKARPPRPSPYAGTLRGSDVLLITLESVGRDHLAMFTPDAAHTPFLEGLYACAATSSYHFAPSPLTTNAHVILAHGRYRAEGEPQLQRLTATGYRTAYLTSARTRYNGLSAVIARSGYQTMIDRARLGIGMTDRELPDAGVDALIAELATERSFRRRPLFLHVHTCDTHVPYRVRDARFRRRDDSRRGRFLDAVEEADDSIARLYDTLIERGVLHDPLIVVTSDHGEGFGSLGYNFHATAVTAEQTLVPLALAHPSLPQVIAPWSSHLDLLPTILDLAGVPAAPTHGDSLFHLDRQPRLVLWAGHPLRSTTSCYGLLDGDRKLMVDLTTDRCMETDWEDHTPRILRGRERHHAQAVTTAAFRRLGLD